MIAVGWICAFIMIVLYKIGESPGWIIALLSAFAIVGNWIGRYCYKLGKQKETRTLNQDLASQPDNQEGESGVDYEL